MNAPRYSYSAINTLALSDTGHFVFLDAWSISLLASMLSQNMPLYLWTNNQFPLTEGEIDDLENKLATAGGQLMQSLVGLIIPVSTLALPQGTLLCDGSTYLRADYPNLYDALDPAFILDPDSFVVPDMRDRFVMGASAAASEGTTGGSNEVTQTIAQMPIHAHSSPPHAHSEITATPTVVSIGLEPPVPSALAGVGSTGLTAVSIDNAGGGEPMTITPPYIALRYVVVAL
jgi:microcystin-dependent protein